MIRQLKIKCVRGLIYMAVLLQFLLPMTANGAPYYARAKINQDSSTNWAGYAADTGRHRWGK